MPDDTVSISGSNPEVMASISAANQAEAAGNADARVAAATRALTAWADARRTIPPENPAGAIEAGQRLEHLSKDAAWRNKFMAGDTAARREFDLLNAQVATGDPTELAIAGVKPAASVDKNSGALPDARDLPVGVQHLRERGYPDHQIREILSGTLLADDGKPLSEGEVQAKVTAAEAWLERASRDAEFRRKYLSGDRDAAGVMMRAVCNARRGEEVMGL
jgi:hypothetical protein